MQGQPKVPRGPVWGWSYSPAREPALSLRGGKNALLQPTWFFMAESEPLFFRLREIAGRLRQCLVLNRVVAFAVFGDRRVSTHQMGDRGTVHLGVLDLVATKRRPIGD